MENNKEHFRHILLFYYRKGKNAVQARKKLCEIYGEDVLTERQCQNWFAKFRSENFNIKDAPRSGRPVKADEDKIKVLIEANRRITTRELGRILNLSNSTVHDHLKRLGFVSKLDIWGKNEISFRTTQRLSYTFRGLVVPVHTPFTEDGSLNLTVIPKYAKYLASRKIPGILVNGTTGEGMSMSVAERKLVAKAWSNEIKTTGQHLIIQVGGAPLPDVIELARHAESLHANAILCLPDLYWKPTTPQRLIEYLEIVGNAAPTIPLLYYHIPMFTNVNIHMGKFLESIGDKIPSFVGIKFTSANLEEGVQALRADEYKYVIFLGNDQIINAAHVSGIDSFMLASINIYPNVVQNLVAASKNKNITEAKNMQEDLSRAITNITKHGDFVSTMKVALAILTDINTGSSRPPLKTISTEIKNIMIKELTKLDS